MTRSSFALPAAAHGAVLLLGAGLCAACGDTSTGASAVPSLVADSGEDVAAPDAAAPMVRDAAPGCTGSLNDWKAVRGELQMGVGWAEYAGDIMITTRGSTSASRFAIDPTHPEAAGTTIDIDGPIGMPVASWRVGDLVFEVERTIGATNPIGIVDAAGHVTLSTLPSYFASLQPGAIAATNDRVAVIGGDGAGTIEIDLLGIDLQPVGSFKSPKHAFGGMKADNTGFHFADINVMAHALEVYGLTDTGPALVRTHALSDAQSDFPISVGWAGDSVVLGLAGRLQMIDPDDTRTTIDLPLADGGDNLPYNMTVSTSGLGVAIGIVMSNLAYVGLMRPGRTIEWAGPTEQGVFSKVRVDDASVGVYSIVTEGGKRTLSYFGRSCL